MRQANLEPLERTNRRGWLTGAVRVALLGGLAAVSGHLLLRSHGDCERQLPCQKCGQRASCRLPQAVKSRQKGQG